MAGDASGEVRAGHAIPSRTDGISDSKVEILGVGVLSTLSSRELSGPVRDTPPYRALPFRDSIAEGGIAPFVPCFHVVSHKYR